MRNVIHCAVACATVTFVAAAHADQEGARVIPLDGYLVAAAACPATGSFVTVTRVSRAECDVSIHGDAAQSHLDLLTKRDATLAITAQAALDYDVHISGAALGPDGRIVLAGQTWEKGPDGRLDVWEQDAWLICLSADLQTVLHEERIAGEGFDGLGSVCILGDESFLAMGHRELDGANGDGTDFLAQFDSSFARSVREVPVGGRVRRVNDDLLVMAGSLRAGEEIATAPETVSVGPRGREDAFVALVELPSFRVRRAVVFGSPEDDEVTDLCMDEGRLHLTGRCGTNLDWHHVEGAPPPAPDWDCAGIEMAYLLSLDLETLDVTRQQMIRGNDTIRGEAVAAAGGSVYVDVYGFASHVDAMQWNEADGVSPLMAVLELRPDARTWTEATRTRVPQGENHKQLLLRCGDRILQCASWGDGDGAKRGSEIRVLE